MEAPFHSLPLAEHVIRKPCCRRLRFEVSEDCSHLRITLRRHINGGREAVCIIEVRVLTLHHLGWRRRLAIQLRDMHHSLRPLR
jgi:hypothetical protein